VESASNRAARRHPGRAADHHPRRGLTEHRDEGKVSSRGQNPGADPLHLEGGCSVSCSARGSTGVGHAVPNSRKNHCNNSYLLDSSHSSTTCGRSGRATASSSTADSADGTTARSTPTTSERRRTRLDRPVRPRHITIDGGQRGPLCRSRQHSAPPTDRRACHRQVHRRASATGSAWPSRPTATWPRPGRHVDLEAAELGLDTASIFGSRDSPRWAARIRRRLDIRAFTGLRLMAARSAMSGPPAPTAWEDPSAANRGRSSSRTAPPGPST